MTHAWYVVGDDGEHWAWITPSWTRLGVQHEVWLDRDGKLTCSCENASYRSDPRYAYITEWDASNACKHIRELHGILRDYLARKGHADARPQGAEGIFKR